MNACERQRLRLLVDRAVRERLEPLQERFAGVFFCSACGGDLDGWTPACATCSNRWWQWRKSGKVSLVAFRSMKLAVDRWALARQMEGIELFNRKHPNRSVPRSTWADHRLALGVSDRIVRRS